jgi:hypothetical protein
MCDGNYLYWTHQPTGDVYRANTDGTDFRTLAAGAVPSATDYAIHDNNLYFTIPGVDSKVVSIVKDGSVTRVVTQDSGIRGMSIYNGEAYWFTDSTITNSDGIVHTSSGTIVDVAVDASGVYYADMNAVYVVPMPGDTARRLTRSDVTGGTMLLDTDHVVWGTNTGLVRITKGIGFLETISPGNVSSLAFSGGIYAWMNSAEVHVKRPDAEARLVAPANASGGVALCAGYVFWASGLDGIIARAVP